MPAVEVSAVPGEHLVSKAAPEMRLAEAVAQNPGRNESFKVTGASNKDSYVPHKL